MQSLKFWASSEMTLDMYLSANEWLYLSKLLRLSCRNEFYFNYFW